MQLIFRQNVSGSFGEAKRGDILDIDPLDAQMLIDQGHAFAYYEGLDLDALDAEYIASIFPERAPVPPEPRTKKRK